MLCFQQDVDFLTSPLVRCERPTDRGMSGPRQAETEPPRTGRPRRRGADMAALLLALKATVLLSVALLAVHLRRRAPAVTRHRLWSVAFAAVLALPLLEAALPALDVPVPSGWVSLQSRPDTINESRSVVTQADPSAS